MKKALDQRTNKRKDVMAVAINIVAAALALNFWLEIFPGLASLSYALLVAYAIVLTISTVAALFIWIFLSFLTPFYQARLRAATSSELDEEREIVEEIANYTISARSRVLYAISLLCSVAVIIAAYQVGWHYLFVAELTSEIVKYFMLDKLQSVGQMIQDKLSEIS